jgi:hypothetical protein
MALNFQAFIDDSESHDGCFVLAGYIAPAEKWALFAKEWEVLLGYAGLLRSSGQRYFKMSEMALTSERLEKVPAFYWLIEKYASLAISVGFRKSDLRAGKQIAMDLLAEIGLVVNFGKLDNYFLFAYRALMDMFHLNKYMIESIIPDVEPVDFIFDERSDKGIILGTWHDYVRGRIDEIRKLYGLAPRFESDDKLLPLQAADLWAWNVREWLEAGKAGEDAMSHLKFANWKATKNIPHMSITFNEKEIADTFYQLAIETAQTGGGVRLI